MSDGRSVSGQLKKFVFRGKSSSNGDTRGEYLEIVIPELLTAGYSFYTWPSAPLLAWYLWTQRRHLRGLRVLELGCGTGLPGILAAKCGARVTLTDSVALPRSLRHLSACCEANGLVVNRDVKILGLAWGLFLSEVHTLRPVDLILASDCFYEPSQFEEVLSTVAYLLDGTDARFLCSYQERSADWSIEALLKKWGLKGALLDLDSLSESSGVDYRALFGPVQNARVVFDRSTGLSKGYGFIEFANSSAAADATNKQVHTLEGLNLVVQVQNS
ncbi:hypothetical protein HF086_003604 [Spodoptera exigua]|uniref:RRM domain-containing protein n=1 Tax=Spodoptera exigua TaxID=7107 RepID=A0A922MMA1_SPOEX|nr:hypothetical protein HF086_003604 [Spodoptera exigua]